MKFEHNISPLGSKALEKLINRTDEEITEPINTNQEEIEAEKKTAREIEGTFNARKEIIELQRGYDEDNLHDIESAAHQKVKNDLNLLHEQKMTLREEIRQSNDKKDILHQIDSPELKDLKAKTVELRKAKQGMEDAHISQNN